MNENAKLIAEVYAAFGRGDIPAVLAKIADNAEWNGPANKELPYAGAYKGPGGAAKFFDRIASHLRVTAWEPKTYLAAGDEVMTTGSWSCVALETGKAFSSIWAMRFVVKGGKIVFFQPYEDTAVVVAALRK